MMMMECTRLLTELKRPSIIEGRHHDDPEAKKIKGEILAHYHDPAWRYADEETFFDARERALHCMKFIADLDKSNVLAVTHGGILRMIIAVMLHGAGVEAREALKLRAFLHLDNTGITLCECTSDRGWELVTWNDCAHLEGLASPSTPTSDCGSAKAQGT